MEKRAPQPDCCSSMHYGRVPDRQVVERAQAGDAAATEHLLAKYRNLVRACVRLYFLAGADREDLLQIGMIGLWHSVMDFRCERAMSFPAFARLCVQRHLITAVKTATRRKQALLTCSIPLDASGRGERPGTGACAAPLGLAVVDPEHVVLSRDHARRFRERLAGLLSEFEWSVLTHYQYGKSYKEIAGELHCSTKSIDNALMRIKRKVAPDNHRTRRAVGSALSASVGP